jgi:hypothetical protein
MAGEETIKKIKDLVSPDSSAVNMNNNVAQTGLNMDQSVSQVGKGSLTYALNAAVENFDANSVNYQNEPGNEFCVEFPLGFSLIGHHFIAEQNKHIFFLVNPTTEDSQIGYMDNNDCVYKIYVNAKCLNFNIKYPIHKIVHKITNCTTEIYWTDGINARRYLNLTDIPYILEPFTDPCDPKYTNEVDCNQLKLQPDFKVPLLSVIDVVTGGNLTAGTYQFAIQYADATGSPFTSYYSITNPTPIADIVLTTPNFDYNVGKSIRVRVTDLDETGQFQYFNLAVIKTVNDIPSVELVGTYFIDEFTKEIVFTGQNVTQIRLTINDIFEKYPYYEIAQDLTVVQDVLVWDNLTSIDRINYQEIASQINLQWQTYKLPANENYVDELNATNLRGYLRDEVYAFEIVFLLKNGKQTDGFHIPGRVKSTSDEVIVQNTNPDFIGDGTSAPYWKIYNTAKDLGAATGDKIGNATPHRYGQFAYWESEEEYPCNEDVWGDLKGQRIRHHKFPDVLVSPVFESRIFSNAGGMTSGNQSVFPIGVKIEIEEVKSLILSSNLTNEQKQDIAGFKIVRGDRSTNKSIVAKGILRNVGQYEREGQPFYFPNYPYNDLNADPFLNTGNNAFSQEATPWLVICQETGKYEFTDSNTGKLTTKDMFTGEVYEFCSATRPKHKSGRAKIGPANFSTHKVKGCGAKGAEYYWLDPFTENNAALQSEKRVYVDSCPLVDCSSSYNGLVTNVGGRPRYLGNEFCALGVCVDSCESQSENPRVLQGIGEIDADLKNEPAGSQFVSRGRISSCNCGVSSSVVSVGTSADSARRMVFNSPETSFGNPFLGNIIKLENVLFGRGKGHFVQVKKNANYKLLSKEAQTDALGSSERIAGGNIPALFAAYQSYLTIYVNGITRKNYAYSYNSIADYNYSSEIQNGLGIKQRPLDVVQYLIPGVLNVGDPSGININNYQRESSVYLKTVEDIKASVLVFWKEYEICNKNTPSTPKKPEDDQVFPYINDSYNSDSVTLAPGECKKVIATTIPVKGSGTGTFTITVTNTGSTNKTNIETPPLPYPNQTNSLIDPATNLPKVSDKSRITISEVGACAEPAKEQNLSVVSYYASLKNINVSQWGQIYSYITIDTGFQTNVDFAKIYTTPVTIFGGDTFISRFAFKTKLPFFIDNRVGAPDDSDIFYDEIGNIAYPKYWHSSRSITESRNVAGRFLTNIISYKAHTFDCPTFPGDTAPPTTEDTPGTYRTYYDGYFYLFAYGVPNFYCESSYNTDLRQAFNPREGDFWPHVSTGIPDDWVQESFVSIANDNTYYYNRTFSKQNKENFFSHLPPDWEEKLCFTNYPFRAIYSDPQDINADNRVNNWLSYRAASFFDFPQNYGKLISLDGIQNRAVLARFENKSLLYNTLLTVETSNPQAAYLGNSTLFKSSPPIDFAETDLGYVGSQNKFLLKIPQGQVTVDAKRGQVFLISGNQATDLSAFGSGMNRFFTDHLAFEILRYFPDLEQIINNERIIVPGVNIDNHFNGIGLHGVYDSKYDRIIITKLDYVPLSDDVKYDYDTKDFYVEEIVNDSPIRTIIYLSDTEYFCNKSWTLSFNLNTKTWVSFHSYLPNFYMGENNFFYSGLNGCCDGLSISSFEAFDSIVTSSLAEVVDRTTTTTTTTDVPIPDPIIPCDFYGIAQYTCQFYIDATVYTTTTTTTTCPVGENTYTFVTGYTVNSVEVVSTLSLETACNAGSLFINNALLSENCNFLFSTVTVSANGLEIRNNVYNGCSLLEDGWYVTTDYGGDNLVYNIVGGEIFEIASCVITTTDTTTIAPNIQECCTNIYVVNDQVKYGDTTGNYILDFPGYVPSLGIAMTVDKFWAINTQINEWDITLSPFSSTFNRNISLPGGFTTSSGIVPINNTTLIAVNDTPSPQKVVELDINTTTAALTNKFDLQADRTAIGNFLYTVGGKLILINQDTITSDYYLSQYDYSTGTLEVDFNMESFDAMVVFSCDNVIYLANSLGKVVVVVNTYPGYELLTLFPPSGITTTSVAQVMSCVPASLTGNSSLTTTTTLPPVTYCYTVTLDGQGSFLWTNSSGELDSVEVDGPQSITACAVPDSFEPIGTVTFTFCTDYFPCTTEGDCPTTTSTTTEIPTTTTTTTTP